MFLAGDGIDLDPYIHAFYEGLLRGVLLAARKGVLCVEMAAHSNKATRPSTSTPGDGGWASTF